MGCSGTKNTFQRIHEATVGIYNRRKEHGRRNISKAQNEIRNQDTRNLSVQQIPIPTKTEAKPSDRIEKREMDSADRIM